LTIPDIIQIVLLCPPLICDYPGLHPDRHPSFCTPLDILVTSVQTLAQCLSSDPLIIHPVSGHRVNPCHTPSGPISDIPSFPFCFGHSPLQPFLCWFLLGIHPKVVYNSFHTSRLVLHSLPISGCTSRFSSRAPDMFPDEFPQSGYHIWTFPHYFRKFNRHFH
jgi:hypothetical protein